MLIFRGTGDQAQGLLDPFEPDGLIVGDAGVFPAGSFEQILERCCCSDAR